MALAEPAQALGHDDLVPTTVVEIHVPLLPTPGLPDGSYLSFWRWRPAWPRCLEYLRVPLPSSVTTTPRSSVWDGG
jgi:hypothetical protein